MLKNSKVNVIKNVRNFFRFFGHNLEDICTTLIFKRLKCQQEIFPKISSSLIPLSVHQKLFKNFEIGYGIHTDPVGNKEG